MASLHEECGVIGIYDHPEASNLTFLGLHALQHRGQEGCGIVVLNEKGVFRSHKAFGLVAESFSQEKLSHLGGNYAIGHVRYSTAGGKKNIENLQPFFYNTSIGKLSICHNGNLTNANDLRKEMESQGSIFHSSSDTEVFMHLIAKSGAHNVMDAVAITMRLVKGAYSLVLLAEDGLYAVRDPFGFRPLVLGKKGNSYIVASETCALDLIEATYERDIEPGEMIKIDRDGVHSHRPLPKRKGAFCSFEPIYFSRPDSLLNGQDIYSIRKRIGNVLAEESAPDNADVVIAIPDSGVAMAHGFAEKSGLKYELGLVRNHYIGRTFIEPTQEIRNLGVKLKLNPVSSVLKGRSVVVVDDSIVRGTTSVKIVRMLRAAGAREIHVRIGSPPITHSCYFGVDTPSREKLIAAQSTTSEIVKMLEADSLAFLSTSGLEKAIHGCAESFCFGCFSGEYPDDICRKIAKQPTDENGPGLYAKR